MLTCLQNKAHWEKAFNRAELKFEKNQKLVKEFRTIIDSGQYLIYAEQLYNGTYTFQPPRKVEIAKVGTAKKRVVYMYSPLERFIQGVMYRAMSEYYGDRLYPNCFSYRQGVNTLSAITYIKNNKQTKEMYGLKMDISAYFNSVGRTRLKGVLEDLCPSDKLELAGFKKTLDSIYLDDTVLITEYNLPIEEYKSLIAGSPLASFFANYCLKDIDAYFYTIKDEVIYARYSDDIIIMCETHEEIEKYRTLIVERLQLYGLKINPKKYESFSDEDAVEYLGLELSKDGVDLAKHTIKKVKRQIKRWVTKERKRIENYETTYEKAVRNITKRLKHKYFKSFIINPTKYGWGYYAFRFVTTVKSLKELDFYLLDQLRYLYTGKHNKANARKVQTDTLIGLGYISLVDMYNLFRTDFDYYVEVCTLL